MLTYSSATPYGLDRQALTGVVQSLLITKHMLFVGFSLRDDAFNQLASAVRLALQPSNRPPRVEDGTPPQPDRLPSPREREPTLAVAAAVQPFGSALTLSERPFLFELWPELECVPMCAGASSLSDQARRRRTLEIFLDRLCLDATDTEAHLLAPEFAGVLVPPPSALERCATRWAPEAKSRARDRTSTPPRLHPSARHAGTHSDADRELRAEVATLVGSLRAEPLATRADAFAEVRPAHAAPPDAARGPAFMHVRLTCRVRGRERRSRACCYDSV